MSSKAVVFSPSGRLLSQGAAGGQDELPSELRLRAPGTRGSASAAPTGSLGPAWARRRPGPCRALPGLFSPAPASRLGRVTLEDQPRERGAFSGRMGSSDQKLGGPRQQVPSLTRSRS